MPEHFNYIRITPNTGAHHAWGTRALCTFVCEPRGENNKFRNEGDAVSMSDNNVVNDKVDVDDNPLSRTLKPFESVFVLGNNLCAADVFPNRFRFISHIHMIQSIFMSISKNEGKYDDRNSKDSVNNTERNHERSRTALIITQSPRYPEQHS